MWRSAAAVAAVAALTAGCGGRAHERRAAPEWARDARAVIAQLEGDVTLTAQAGASTESARRALHSSSDLYELVFAYSDLGGCRSMIGAIGATPSGYARIVRDLDAACVRLRRASDLFTHASVGADPSALLAASRGAAAAQPLLEHARFELRLRDQT